MGFVQWDTAPSVLYFYTVQLRNSAQSINSLLRVEVSVRPVSWRWKLWEFFSVINFSRNTENQAWLSSLCPLGGVLLQHWAASCCSYHDHHLKLFDLQTFAQPLPKSAFVCPAWLTGDFTAKYLSCHVLRNHWWEEGAALKTNSCHLLWQDCHCSIIFSVYY